MRLFVVLSPFVLALPALAQPVLITAATTVGPSDTTIIDQASLNVVPLATAEITLRGTTLTISGRHTIASLLVESVGSTAGIITHPVAATFVSGNETIYGIDLTVTGNAEIRGTLAQNGFQLDGRGFGAATGPGAGTSSTNTSSGGAGGGHAGAGTNAGAFPGGIAYGSILAPTDLGSGGGNYSTLGTGGAGGGRVKLSVGGTFTHNGVINASGTSGTSAAGCGSGGSIHIIAGTLAGNGAFRANGARDTGWGGGSGGRIVIDCGQSLANETIEARGGVVGTATEVGAAGTIVKIIGGGTPNVVLDAGATNPPARETLIPIAAINTLTLRGGSQARFTNAVTIAQPLTITSRAIAMFDSSVTLSGALQLQGGSVARFAQPVTIPGELGISGGSILTLPPGLTQVGGGLVMNGSNSSMRLTPGNASTLQVIGSATVGAGTTINGDSAGFAWAQGPGAGTTSPTGSYGGAGAGHGGQGPAAGPLAGGAQYGSISQPTQMGSGGGGFMTSVGGAGGGALRLSVSGALTVDGAIRCNGTPGVSAAGAGSGGSLWISAPTIAGIGSIEANGGDASAGWGGGAGGRIAAYWDSSTFTGTFTARGGSASATAHGGAGTVYLKPSGQAFADLVIASGGNVNTPTALTTIDLVDLNSCPVRNGANVLFTGDVALRGPLDVSGGATVRWIGDCTFIGDAQLSGGARCSFDQPVSFSGALRLSGASRLTLAPGLTPVNGALEMFGSGNVLTWTGPDALVLDLRSTTLIDAGSSIDGNGKGFGSDAGPGAGTISLTGTYGGAGAGHGGRGANAGPLAGGATYGFAEIPEIAGSGGGSFIGTPGGAGGGALRIISTGAITLNGSIAMNGRPGTSASGSGSGGAVYIEAPRVQGGGTISANGGDTSFWGAAGGGRVAIYACEMLLPINSVTANRGTSSGVQAQAGTVVFGSSSIEITAQPPNLTVLSGRPLEFSVGAITTQQGGQLSYLWRKRSSTGEFIAITEGFGGRFSGTATPTLRIDPTECEDAGEYDCLVVDTCGTFPSRPAVIIVDPIADYNDDNGVDSDDVIDFFADWDVSRQAADLTLDGGVDSDDVIFFFGRWDLGC